MYQPETEKRSRVGRVVDPAYKVGGLTAQDDHASDAAMIKKAFGQHDSQLHGGAKTRLRLSSGGMADGGMAPPRSDQRSRGAKAHPKSQVNVVIAPSHAAPPAGPAMPPAMPPRPVIAPPPALPPGAAGAPPPGGPPGAMPPGAMPMRPPGMMPPGAPGPGAMPPRPMIKTGGRTPHMSAGAGSGEGRLEKKDRLDT